MYKIYFLLLILLAILKVQSNHFDYFHTTDEINDGLEELAKSCKHLSIVQVKNNPDIRVAKFKKDINKKLKKAFVLFGEHPRELISSETGFHLAKKLCSNDEEIEHLLMEYQIQLMINSNPISRKKVETGDYCLRENENGVDINRNYDSHWEFVQDAMAQTDSGPKPFSEPETQAIRTHLEEYLPEFFLTVHSGTLGLYTPYAYSNDEASQNEDNMLNILTEINDKYCKRCGVGSAGKEVGYLCPGTSLDWVYDTLDCKYSFAMEIYDNDVLLDQAINPPAQTFLAKNTKISFKKKLKKTSQKVESCFIQTQTLAKTTTQVQINYGEADTDFCFKKFNPPDQEKYEFYVENWSSAILNMIQKTVES